METNNKQQPVRITYKIVKKNEQIIKSQENHNFSEVIVAEIEGDVSQKQKRVLVAFVEEQGKDGGSLMCGTTREVGSDNEIMETVGGGLWREVAVMLNSARVGGCVKSPQEWKKYWLKLLENTKQSVNQMQEMSARFKIDSLPVLQRRIYKLATGQYDVVSINATADASLPRDFNLNINMSGGALIKELAEQIDCKDVVECDKLIDRVTSSEMDFDAVYLEEGVDAAGEFEDEMSQEEDTGQSAQIRKGHPLKIHPRKRRRLTDWTQTNEASGSNTKFQSTVNFLRLKQERLKVYLLEREVELRNTEIEHKRQVHEAEMKRRQMEMIHMDAMHNKILHMSHI